MTKTIASALFVVSLGGVLIGYLLLHPWLVGLCAVHTYCLDESVDLGVGSPLFWSIYLLPPLFFVLMFVKPAVFKTWAKVFVPLAIIGFILIAMSSPLGDPLRLEFSRTQVTDFVVKVLVLVSIIVIVWKYWRLSRKGTAA